MDLYSLCREADIGLAPDIDNCDISGIETDSRRVCAGMMFICIRGGREDGHHHIEEALTRGAAALVVERISETPMPRDVPVIVVTDSRHSAALLYDAWYGHPADGMKLVAVTGTNGKTSVTHMLKAIFEGAMHRCGLIGTVDCYSAGRRLAIRSEDPLASMTTPDPAELYHMLRVMADDGVEYVFIEATSHALALCKPDALRFEMGIFTNLTPEHLDFHRDMENYYLAKKRLFSMCKTAILNIDDAYGRRLSQELTCPILTCSAEGRDADLSASDICELGIGGSEYILTSDRARLSVRVPIPGTFSVMNSLEACACGIFMGLSPGEMAASLRSLAGIAGRMERIKIGVLTDFSVFIDYAHTPDALENLLRSARRMTPSNGRLVLVFGCGGDRDKSKRPIMGRLAAELADLSIVTSDNSRSEEPMDIIADIIGGMCMGSYTVESDRGQAIDRVIRQARSGDVIVLAGKGHEEYEIDKDGKHPFSERHLVCEAALRYHGGGGEDRPETKEGEAK